MKESILPSISQTQRLVITQQFKQGLEIIQMSSIELKNFFRESIS